jgi:hypothetical protein
VLRASRQLLRPGGRTAFSTIHPAPGLDERRRREAHRAGPVAVATGNLDHVELMTRAGFVAVEEIDGTPEFAVVTRAWVDEWDRHREALVEVLGPAGFHDRQRGRQNMLRAIEHGVLQRSLVVGRAPLTD